MFKSTIWNGVRRATLRVSNSRPAFRTYATLQERVALSNERQWQLAAVAVTVPGLMYLRNVYNQRLHHTQSTQQPQTMQQKVGSMVKDSPMAQQAVRTITSSVPREQMAQAMQQTKETAKEMMDTAATEVEKTKVAAKELLGSGSSSGMSTPKSEASSESATPSKKVEDS